MNSVWTYAFFLSFLFLVFVYLAALGPNCSAWGLQSSLQHVGSLAAACEFLVVVCGIQFPNQALNPGPCIGSLKSQPLDHQRSPWIYAFISFMYITRSGVVWSHFDLMFNLLKNCLTVFHSSRAIFHPHQQCMRAQISPHVVNTCYYLPSYYSHPNGYEAISYCGFNLQFPNC